MTVQATVRKVGATPGNSLATVFPFAFKVFLATDLAVTLKTISTGVETTLVLNDPLGYTVALNADQNANPGGSITYNPAGVAMPATQALTISSVVPELQGTHIINGGAFFANNIEDAVDKVVINVQDLALKVGQSLQVPVSDPAPGKIPAAVVRANRVLGFDANGDPTTLAANITVYGVRESVFVAAAAQVLFNLGFLYVTGVNALSVYVNGLRMVKGLDYVETSTSSITFLFPLAANDRVAVYGGQELTGVGSIFASLVSYTLGVVGAITRNVQSWISDQAVNAKDFGAVGDGITDDATALQAAIDYCVARAKTLYIPSGQYKISRPLIAYNWNGVDYTTTSITIQGETGTYAAAPSTQIVPTFKDGFAIGVHIARFVTFRDLSIVGLNNFVISGDFHELNNASAYFVGAGCRDTQYSPYAGIAIDPFTNSAATIPADGGYPGLAAYYRGTGSNGGSAYVNIERCGINGFVAGVVISPNGSTANADQINIRQCSFSTHKIAVATCQSQSRSVNVYNSSFDACYLVHGTNMYGSKNGTTARIRDIEVSRTKYLLRVGTAIGENTFSGIYCESLVSIGFVGLGASGANASAQFNGCNFALLPMPAGTKQVDTHLFLNDTVAVFDGCVFTWAGASGEKSPFRIFINAGTGNSADALFNACTFQGTSDALGGINHFATQCLNAAGSNLLFHNCRLDGTFNRQKFSTVMNVYQIAQMNKQLSAPGCFFAADDNVLKMYHAPALPVVVAIGAPVISDLGNGTATFNAVDATILQVGDAIYTTGVQIPVETALEDLSLSWYGCVGIITNIAGALVTLGYITKNFNAAAMNNLSLVYMPKLHEGTTGDTHTNTTVDNVSKPAAWQNKDRPRGAGIPAGAYITAGGGTAAWTLSKAATATAAGIRLYDADITVFTGAAL